MTIFHHLRWRQAVEFLVKISITGLIMAGLFTVGSVFIIAEILERLTPQNADIYKWVGSFALTLLATTTFCTPFWLGWMHVHQKQKLLHKVSFYSYHDGLTELYNRSRFTEILNGKLAQRFMNNGEIAVIYVDLDRLKEINDSFGHDAGDEMIASFGADLRKLTNEKTFVARLGGDEFAIAQTGIRSRTQIHELTRSVLKLASRTRYILDHPVSISASIGVSWTPSDGQDASTLMNHAALALKHSKRRRGGHALFFEPGMDLEAQKRRDIEQSIRHAFETESFQIYFQPLINVKTNRLTGFEALLRLPDGKGGYIPPDLFIPVAEDIDLISKIGAWTLNRSCHFAALWPDYLSLAINLSPAQFNGSSLSETVRNALRSSGLAANRLELEITEGLLLVDNEAVMDEITTLKSLGASIVMDDFGIGYSSLSYLWKFPFDKIKIDRSFMKALEQNDVQVTDILQAILAMSRSLHLRVTAEGIETEAQANLLRDMACDEFQGFYFGRPMPETDVASAILKDNTQSEHPMLGSKIIAA